MTGSIFAAPHFLPAVYAVSGNVYTGLGAIAVIVDDITCRVDDNATALHLKVEIVGVKGRERRPV